MKKLLAILLALAMVLSLAACGAGSDDDDDKKDKKNKNEAVEDVESDEDEDVDDNDDKDDKPAKGDKEDEDDKPAKDDKDDKPAKDEGNQTSSDLILGATSGSDYENDSLGLEFTRPSSSWSFLSGDELSEMLGSSDSSNGNVEDLLATYGMYYDMCCVNESTGGSVQIVVQDLSSFGYNTDDADITEDELMDIIIEGMSTSVPISNVDDYENVVLGDNVYKKALCGFTISGVSGEMACYLRMGGDYLVYIVVMTVVEDVDTIEACFG